MTTSTSTPAADAMFEVRRLNKSFDQQQWVLDDIDLKLLRGKTTVILGPSGSGKSTLLRCLNLLEEVDSGAIWFDGREITKEGPRGHLLRREISMVFQHYELFPHLSVLENLMIAPVKVLGVAREQALEQAMELLTKVRIREKADAYPEQLSGGQQQRVAIARALMMNPKAILFDEPTSALDPEMVKEVLDVMVELAGSGITCVVVTHELGFARRAADRVVLMEGGRIVEESAKEHFFSGQASERTQRFLQQMSH